jgi:hypothetical protein
MPDTADEAPDRLPNGTVVVRGGLMLPADLIRSAQSHRDVEGLYALSVYSIPGATAEEIARGVPLPHAKIRTSTVGRIRAAGYDVLSSPGPPGHADLVLPTPPTDKDGSTLDGVFDPARPNPATMRDGDV